MTRKVPKHAKKVYHGQVFQVYSWQQRLFNGSTTIFENVKAQDGVAVIANHKGKIVVLKQQQPGTKWYDSLPGGALDHEGEDPKSAAKRELLEETGLEAKKLTLWKKFPAHGRISSTYTVFVASQTELVGEQQLDGGEKIKVFYKNFEEFLKLSDSDDFGNKDVIIGLLRARLDKKEKDKLKKLIFGK